MPGLRLRAIFGLEDADLSMKAIEGGAWTFEKGLDRKIEPLDRILSLIVVA